MTNKVVPRWGCRGHSRLIDLFLVYAAKTTRARRFVCCWGIWLCLPLTNKVMLCRETWVRPPLPLKSRAEETVPAVLSTWAYKERTFTFLWVRKIILVLLALISTGHLSWRRIYLRANATLCHRISLKPHFLLHWHYACYNYLLKILEKPSPFSEEC